MVFSGLTGTLFPNLSDSAYSAQRIYLGLGFTVGFVIAEVLSVQGRVWLMLGATVLALIAVFIVEFKTHKFCLLRRVNGEPGELDNIDINIDGVDKTGDTKTGYTETGDTETGDTEIGDTDDMGVSK